MNLRLFICSTCENKDDEEMFLYFNNKNLNNNNIKKSNLSSSDNNNSTNNYLEVIEYPYSNTSNNNSIEHYIPEPLPVPIQTSVLNKKIFNDYDNFLDILKPPKLFTEGHKENKETAEKTEKNIFEETKEKKESIMNEDENNKNILVNDSYNINNENSFLQTNNDEFILNKYYKDSNEVLNNNETNNEKTIKNDNNDRNCNINHFKLSGNINGLKVDYPCPDTDSFFIKSCNDELNINIQDKETNNNKITKKIENNKDIKKSNLSTLKKVKNTKDKYKDKNKKNKNKNSLNKIEIKNPKNIKNNNNSEKLIDNKKIFLKYQKNKQTIRNNSNLETNKYNKKKINNTYGVLTQNIKSNIKKDKYQKLSIKPKIINAKDSGKNNYFFSIKTLENSEYEYNSLKTDINTNTIINENKNKSRLYNNKIILKYRHSTSKVSEKKKKIKLKPLQFLRPHNKTIIDSSKININPFSTIYCKKKKSFFI